MYFWNTSDLQSCNDSRCYFVDLGGEYLKLRSLRYESEKKTPDNTLTHIQSQPSQNST